MSLILSERPQNLTPELLDHLPANHPDAIQSRKDIRGFNRVLGNWRWFTQVLPRLARPGEKILELGAGTGELCAQLEKQGLWADGLDLVPRAAQFSPARTWHQVDLFNFAEWAQYPVVIGNLFVHHFDSSQLAVLGSHLNEHARLVIVGDLRRGRIQQFCFAALARLFRANHVSRHDGWVSVGAGFRRQELPHLLGLDPERWRWKTPPHVFAYRMIAERR